MGQRAIVETVFKAVAAALPTELGALLGQELSCSEPSYSLTTKEKLFTAEPRTNSSLSHLKVSGDHEGEAFLILPVKTSIIFGGTLIMLPQGQIDENVAKQQLDGEVADAYGEVANILAGVLTQVFLDKYSKSLRFVRTEVDILSGSSIDMAADKPCPPGTYFHFSTELNMDGQPLGKLEIIAPADILGLGEEEQSPTEPAPEAKETTAPAKSKQSAAVAEVTTIQPPAFADAKKVADLVLKTTISQVAEEVGALLGQDFTCTDLNMEMVTKEEFLSNHCIEKSVLSSLTVSGATTGEIYLVNQTKDAILMGGTLIMLPEEEIQSSIGKGEFKGEVEDAYGEVANIISGGLTATFLERYPQQLRFVKSTSEIIIPTKLSVADDAPFPDGLYYLASCAISLQGNPQNKMYLLFPADILGLGQQAANIAQAVPSVEEVTKAAGSASAAQAATASSRPAPPPPPTDATPVLLIITDAPEASESISLNLKNEHYEIKVIGYKDDVRTVFSAHPVIGIFLLMSEVGEKGFSVAIKLQSSGYSLPPIIAGGPEWTRSAVLKAVKYGARDILVTPATDEEIRSKASLHISIPA